ncbi:MAG: TetR/AcrR family transcriptional regulator [Gemmatimonas sp.]
MKEATAAAELSSAPANPGDSAAEPATRTEERRRMRPEERRNAVLDAALRVFADAGFRRASLAEIGDEAGVTKGCVYHYFDSKEELLLALMRERSSSAARACMAGAEPTSREEALSLMVRSLWRKFERDGQRELSMVALTELQHAPSVARVWFDEVVTRNRAYLRDVLHRTRESEREQTDQEEKPAAPAVSDELAAMLVPYMVMGAALGYRLYRDIDPVERSADDIEAALISVLTRGLA